MGRTRVWGNAGSLAAHDAHPGTLPRAGGLRRRGHRPGSDRGRPARTGVGARRGAHCLSRRSQACRRLRCAVLAARRGGPLRGVLLRCAARRALLSRAGADIRAQSHGARARPARAGGDAACTSRAGAAIRPDHDDGAQRRAGPGRHGGRAGARRRRGLEPRRWPARLRLHDSGRRVGLLAPYARLRSRLGARPSSSWRVTGAMSAPPTSSTTRREAPPASSSGASSA